jgi:ankyrin repeat protein
MDLYHYIMQRLEISLPLFTNSPTLVLCKVVDPPIRFFFILLFCLCYCTRIHTYYFSQIRVYIYKGADLDFQDVNGLTPLMIAANYGNLKSVKVLIDLGANCRMVDNRGYSALHFAALKNRIEVVKFMFGKIPPLSPRATLATHLKEIAEWPTRNGMTAMALASQQRHHRMVELLSMALLYSEVPTMPGHLLVIQLEIYGVTLEHGGTLDLGRIKLMEYLKKIFGLKNCALPMY